MSQDKSFFVSRTELLAWLNDLLQIDYKKVEDCASGKGCWLRAYLLRHV